MFDKTGNTYRNGKYVIETFAIITVNNNVKAANNEIICYENPETILNRYSFNYYLMKDKRGDNGYLIYNLALRDAKSLSKYFGQRSFIFGKNTDEGLIFELWAKKKESSNDYSMLDNKSVCNEIDDRVEMITQVLKDFKIRIPAKKFEFNDDEVMKSLYSKYFISDIYRKNFEHNLEESLNEKLTFMGRVTYRGRLKNK